MPTLPIKTYDRRVGRAIRLPGGLTGRRKPVDLGSVHYCAEACVHITPLHRVLIELLAAGLTNAEMAQVLGIAQVTVREHFKAMYKKFQIHDRTQLALMAHATGLIAP